MSDPETIIEHAKGLGLGLEAAQARAAMQRENNAKAEVDRLRAATDAAMAALYTRGGDNISYTHLAYLLGIKDRQTCAMRVNRHSNKETQ